MGYEAIHIYEQIPEDMHDLISYVCILNACSHSGLVDPARKIFKKIPKKNEIIVTSMVCLLDIKRTEDFK